MTIQTQALLAILLYLSFFAWIGWRRGLTSELIVLVTAVLGWVVLLERDTLVVGLTNRVAGLAGELAAEIAGGEAGAAAAPAGGELVMPGTETGFLFLVWIVLVVLAYVFSSRPYFRLKGKHNGWAALVGILNGFFFLAVLLPVLTAAYALQSDFEQPLANFVALIVDTLSYFVDMFMQFWEWVSPVNATVLLIILTLLLALTAMTLRRGARAR